MSNKEYIAIDLGAESGRVIIGRFDGRRLELQEIYRFPNGPVEQNGSLHWDVSYLFSEVKKGLTKAACEDQNAIISAGVDTWGVDYALLDHKGKLLGNPYHYRDRRTEGVMEKVVSLIGRDYIYECTGIQFMPINTLYQLVAESEDPASQLTKAGCLLFIPDLIGYWLTGAKVNELTNASTSQLYDPCHCRWAEALFSRVGLPVGIMCDIAKPGTQLGMLNDTIGDETGLRDLSIVLPGTHDTASAIAAVPARQKDWAYISSGTWSLMGVETSEPVISTHACKLGLTNEIGVFNTVRLLKNISGMWLLHQCRNTWVQKGVRLSYSEITDLAGKAPKFKAFIDPDHRSFMTPGDMPGRIVSYCLSTGQTPPSDAGSYARTIMESLAFRYRQVLGKLEDITGRRINTIHIVGGGSQNVILNQFTANATGRIVVAGPVEATAAGNILVQLIASGEVSTLEDGREIIGRSSNLVTYHPEHTAEWDDAYDSFIGYAINSEDP